MAKYIVGQLNCAEGQLYFVPTSGEWCLMTISKKYAKEMTRWGQGDNIIYKLVEIKLAPVRKGRSYGKS